MQLKFILFSKSEAFFIDAEFFEFASPEQKLNSN